MRYFIITVRTKHTYITLDLYRETFPSRKMISREVAKLNGEEVEFNIINIFEFKNVTDYNNFYIT